VTAPAAAAAATPRARSRRTRGAAVSISIFSLLIASAAAARAQGCVPASFASAARRAWPAPLDRLVTLRARDIPLRDALDRLSAAAGVRLSYTSELLPLDRRVCLSAARVPLGDALAALVGGAGAEPVVVAGQVVLAPKSAPTADAPAATPERESVLERIVVTGTPGGGARRGLSVGLDVLEGPDLARRSASTLAEAMDASVPGVWLWRRSPSNLLAQYGSMRGASSFAATYPKVYIDGIEAANPLVVTQIDPDLVERVEVIRGPQGAALYGSDAISGVINIVTRHDAGGGRRVEFRSDGGVASSDFAAGPVATHRERLAFRAGDNLRSMAAAVTVGGTGAVFPDAGSRTVTALATGRWVAPRAIFTGTFRYFDQTGGAGHNPLIVADTGATATETGTTYGAAHGQRWQGEHAAAAPPPPPPDSASAAAYPNQGMRHYTVGANAMLQPGRWSVSLLAGLDGYRLDHVADSSGPFPSSIDPTLRSGTGAGDRLTFRAAGSTRVLERDDATADLSVALEHSVLRERTAVAVTRPPPPGETYPVTTTEMLEDWQHDTGVLAQAVGSWRNTLFANAGVRVERNDAFGSLGDFSTLPMLGAAWVHAVGPADVKLRAAYGRGIRPPRVPARDALHATEHGFGFALQPEAQAGYELGAELYFQRALSLQLTRFDQRATGLIQDVVVAVQNVTHDGRTEQHVFYEPQNVGAISNRGWEMQATARRGPFSLSGALSLTDSRVRTVAPGYGGDLQAGDRMLAVPARTAGLTAQWVESRWTGALTASRAWNWINYDRVKLSRDFAAQQYDWHNFAGYYLRSYWREYDGSTNLRATVTHEVTPGVSLILTGDNLLDRQLGEPDNVTIRAGRTLTLGIRTSF
jgi:iron complex outermembrane recepter protein